MRTGFRWYLSSLLSLTLLAGMTVAAQIPTPDPSSVAPVDPLEDPHTTYPQIVRLSYVEGDVRLSRGKAAEKATGAAWEKAAIDVPLETGVTLVTGSGRAEIEFEDASTAYLGENSVLTLGELMTRASAPMTNLNLLSGTLTLHLENLASGEWYAMKTPAEDLLLTYPTHAYARFDSYLDALAITPQDSSTDLVERSFAPAGLPKPLAELSPGKGHTIYYSGGRRILHLPPDPNQFTAWDQWVAERVAAREAALTSALHASGLAAPVPGLADLAHNGQFFDCAPYGTCWEPNDLAQIDQDEVSTANRTSLPAVRPPAPHLQNASWSPAQQVVTPGPRQKVQVPPSINRQRDLVQEEPFPCSPYAVRTLYARDPITGLVRLVSSRIVGPEYGYGSYRWAVCHTGTWITRNHHYRWVMGRERHHHCPVHWVKSGHTTGYVPLHPRDVAGKPPVNLQHGLFAIRNGKAGVVERVNFTPGSSFRELNSPPREFRRESFAPLERAQAPIAQAHLLNQPGSPAGKPGTAGELARNSLVFNQRAHTFMLSHQEIDGGKLHTSTTPFTARNGAFADNRSSGTFGGNTGGGYRGNGGAGGNGYARGGSGGGNSASHSGGGSGSSSGGGGGSHSGGGASASSGGASSSAASSGGSHK